MRTHRTKMLALLPLCVLTAIPAVIVDLVSTPAVAQESSGRDDDRDESRDGRRDPTAWRRGRSDRDRGEDRDRERDEDRDRDDDDRKSSSRDEDSKSDAEPSKTDGAAAIGNERYAKALIDQLDKNGNKAVDGEELEKLRGPARSADFNKDGFITSDEIVASLATPAKSLATTPPAATTSDKATARASAEDAADEDKGEADESDRERRRRDRRGFFGYGRGDRDGDSGSDSEKAGAKSASASKRVLTWNGGSKTADEKTVRRTYRFTPATEKLPTGLPSWFKSQDKNRDGQVAMSEYSRSWSRSTVARFQQYDVDGDGIITAKEAKEKE